MRILRDVSARRVLTPLVLTPLIWLASACDKPNGEPGGSGGPKFGSTFSPPEADVSAWPEGLRVRVQKVLAGVKQSPGDPASVGMLGAIYYVHGAPAAALACFEHANELAPESVHWWYYLALAHEGAGDRENAIRAYERVLELNADYAACYVRLAKLLVESDSKRAASLCGRAIELSPEDPIAVFALGLCQLAEGETTSALTLFEQAVQLVPDYKEAHEAIARLLTDLNREQEAEQHRAAAETGKEPVVDDRLYETLMRNGLNPDFLLRDVFALADRGLFEQADKTLAILGDVDPEGRVVLTATGIVRARQGQLEEAAKNFRLVLETKPDALDVKARLADVQARLDQPEEAEAGFRAVLEKNPNHKFALEHYSRLLMASRRAEEAESLLRKASERQPNDWSVRLLLGGVLLAMNKDDEAREEFQACLGAAPDDPRARYQLGLLAQRAGDLTTAKKEWEQAVETTPAFLEARVALAQAALQERDFAAAERHLRAGLVQTPEFAGLANSLAWILATSPIDSQRNGEEAVLLAESACEATARSRHEFLDTLAAAYAERERFDDAVKAARDAIRLAQEGGNEASVAAYQKRLESYEQQKPWRDQE